MKSLSLQEIRRVVGGKALSAVPSTLPLISAVCTDTRHMQAGSLFVALAGPNFDGHDYIPEAAAGGAIAALVERVPPVQLPNVHLLQVPSARKAMGQLAQHVRQQMRAKVVGVAGSNGKTSTKYLIDSVLRESLRGTMSPKSYNNDIGVPLAIFPADPMQDYLILEIGTNHPGEVGVLTRIARPDIGVITNCGPEHLEFLGDLVGVRRENASLVEGMNPRGLLVVNGDDADLVAATASYPGRKITFGFSDSNDLFATDIRCDHTGVQFKLNGRTWVYVPMLGRHTAANALAAIAVARRLGLKQDVVIDSLSRTRGPEMRLQLRQVRGIQLLDDTYNANPASMKAALETLQTIEHSGRTIAILGDMGELGHSTARFHRELGQIVGKMNLDALYCVGPQSALVAQEAVRAGMNSSNIVHFAANYEAARALADQFRAGDAVLIKASRVVELEVVAKAIDLGDSYRAHSRSASRTTKSSSARMQPSTRNARPSPPSTSRRAPSVSSQGNAGE